METQSNCIKWKGAFNSSGYGVTWENGKTVYAHRVVAKAKQGEVIRHLCDNKQCVNPEHLKAGSHKDNSEDMVSKNRQARWERAARTKFTRETVLYIRSMQSKISSRKLAKELNMSKSNVLDIWNNNIWKNLI